jgi:hypothetical protein
MTSFEYFYWHRLLNYLRLALITGQESFEGQALLNTLKLDTVLNINRYTKWYKQANKQEQDFFIHQLGKAIHCCLRLSNI